MVCKYVLDTTDRGNGPGVLGSGSYGMVYLVTDAKTKIKYALKTAEKGVCDDTLISALESDIHMRLQHPHLLPGVDIFRPSDVDTCGITLEKVQQGILLPLMDYDLSVIQTEDRDKPKYANFNALRASWQLACALEALYAAGYTHFDIKTQNILQKGDTTYLADFGLSYSTTIPKIESLMFTITYRPPYIVRGATLRRENYMAADLYALGLVFMDITTKHTFRPDWRYYPEDQYVRILAEEANIYLDAVIKFIKDNLVNPPNNMLKIRRMRWNLPGLSLEEMLEYFKIVKKMITPVPLGLTATHVRQELETLWRNHTPRRNHIPPTLRMVPSPSLDAPIIRDVRNVATRVVSMICTVRDNPRVIPHIVELFLAVSKFAKPTNGHVTEGLYDHRSWRIPYLVACHNIVVTFYRGPELRSVNIPYYPENAILYDDAFSGVGVYFINAVCNALKEITYAKELNGRYNFVLPNEPSEFFPPKADNVEDEVY